MAQNFGCVVSSFPQTYLGLPLSNHNLRLTDSNPIMTKGDMRLPCWRGCSLPNEGGAPPSCKSGSHFHACPCYGHWTTSDRGY
jgi:hypothetical protein